MKWNELFVAGQAPSFQDITEFIGIGAPIWAELLNYLEKAYQVQPRMTYSKCSAQPGWNLKYQKSGKSLCTLYPMAGFFIALVVVGAKEQLEAEIALGTFSAYTRELYHKTAPFNGGRWLMIEVKDESVLEDVKTLMAIRVKPKQVSRSIV